MFSSSAGMLRIVLCRDDDDDAVDGDNYNGNDHYTGQEVILPKHYRY